MAGGDPAGGVPGPREPRGDAASRPDTQELQELSDDTTIVFLSDSHIGGDPGHDVFESPAELAALLEEVTALDGPVELVLAGDFFDFLQIGEVPAGEDRASLTVARPEYRRLFAALRSFAAGPGRRVVYLPGNHDAEMWWNPAIRATLRDDGLVHEFARSYAARFASAPGRVVYCEHGNQFDPANAIADDDDPLDTPLGHHIVTDLTRRIGPAGEGGGDRALRDVNKVYPLVAIPELLAGRLFYDLLTQIVRWLLLPLFLAYAVFRAVAYAVSERRGDLLGVWGSDRSLPGARRVFVEIGYNAALLLVVFAVFFVVVRRLSGRFVSSTFAPLPGLGQTETSTDLIGGLPGSDRPLPMGGGLTGREVGVFVSGHTHAPSLAEVARKGAETAVAVNSGCWLRQLRPVRAHAGGPAVFVSAFKLTHVRVRVVDAAVRVELWERPKPAESRLRLAERIAILGRVPAQPADTEPRVVASSGPGGAGATRPPRGAA